jgi:predicted short-subunit dehydrogenase-like oxidoreductase (DUF2520 family)
VSDAGALGHVWIVGAGRTALSLGLRLHRSGAARGLTVTGRRPLAPDHPLFVRPDPAAAYLSSLDRVPEDAGLIVVAVPDGAIGLVVGRLAALPLPAGVPVLHTSGSRGSEALAALAYRGHPVGSAHPLAALSDPVQGADRLPGASWGVEADGDALRAATAIVAACGGRVLRVASGAKPIYHAAAVFASNYVVALLSVAERLMGQAGVAPGDVRPALAALAAGAVENVRATGPAAALSGPVARGDGDTLRLHLAQLSGDDRPLYCLLGREALRLARDAGLDDASAGRLSALLEDLP